MERESNRAVRDEQDSLAPISLDRLTVEEEVALMNRGKGGQAARVAVLLALVGLAGAVWLRHMDVRGAYAAAAGGIDQVSQHDADAFLRCALPGVAAEQTSSSDRLQSAIERASDQLGKAYARQLARCAPELDRLAPDLAALRVPADAASRFADVQRTAAAARLAWQRYALYLSDPQRPYDYVQALPQIEKIGVAWQAYQDQRAAFTTSLRALR